MADEPVNANEQAERAAWAEFQSRMSPGVRQQQERVFGGGSAASPSWQLIVLEDQSDEPSHNSYATFEELAAAIRQLGKSDYAFPFYGWPVRYAAPDDESGLRFLIHPSGKPVPLFEVPEDVRISSSFFIQGFAPKDPGEDDEEEEDEDEEEEEEDDIPGDGSTGVDDEDIAESEDLPDVADEEHEPEDRFPGGSPPSPSTRPPTQRRRQR